MADWTRMLMAQLRSDDGEIKEGPLAGKPHLIMTSTGAKTGEPREAVLSFVRDGEKYVVAGTAGAHGHLELMVPDGDQVPVIYRDSDRGSGCEDLASRAN